MNEYEVRQKWKCPKCKVNDRTIYIENPNRRKCLRCGTELKEDGIIRYQKQGRLI